MHASAKVSTFSAVRDFPCDKLVEGPQNDSPQQPDKEKCQLKDREMMCKFQQGLPRTPRPAAPCKFRTPRICARLSRIRSQDDSELPMRFQ